MNILFILVSLFVVTGCSSQHLVSIPQGVRVANEEMVKSCEFIGDIHGFSSFYGVFVEKGMANAREQAFNQAKKLGANTVVWQPIRTGYGSTEVSGNAYFCKV